VTHPVRTGWDGLCLAVTTLTVLPMPGRRPDVIDPQTAGVAMSLTPLVGMGLGALMAAIAGGFTHGGLQPIAIGASLAVVLALLTRGLHLDGLADTMDALGSYGGRERALTIMKSPEVGPFGVAAIVAVMLLDAVALSSLAAQHAWAAIAIGVGFGRLGIAGCCVRGIASARPNGLGATVAGTVPRWVGSGWLAIFIGLDGWARRGIPIDVPAILAVTGILVFQALRRFGGITGDVLGATCEIGTAVALLSLSAR